MSPPWLPELPRSAPPIEPGMPTKASSPASPAPTDRVIASASEAPPPAFHGCALDRHAGETGRRQQHHDAGDPLVADQQIRAAAEHADRRSFFVATLDQRCEVFDGRRGRQILRGSA